MTAANRPSTPPYSRVAKRRVRLLPLRSRNGEPVGRGIARLAVQVRRSAVARPKVDGKPVDR